VQRFYDKQDKLEKELLAHIVEGAKHHQKQVDVWEYQKGQFEGIVLLQKEMITHQKTTNGRVTTLEGVNKTRKIKTVLLASLASGTVALIGFLLTAFRLSNALADMVVSG